MNKRTWEQIASKPVALTTVVAGLIVVAVIAVIAAGAFFAGPKDPVGGTNCDWDEAFNRGRNVCVPCPYEATPQTPCFVEVADEL